MVKDPIDLSHVLKEVLGHEKLTIKMAAALEGVLLNLIKELEKKHSPPNAHKRTDADETCEMTEGLRQENKRLKKVICHLSKCLEELCETNDSPTPSSGKTTVNQNVEEPLPLSTKEPREEIPQDLEEADEEEDDDNELLKAAIQKTLADVSAGELFNVDEKEDELITEWRQKALQEAEKAKRETRLDKMPGRPVLLCIDTSDSMKSNWAQATTFVKDYLNEIQQLWEQGSRYDWIGMITFGNGVNFVQKPTQDLERLKSVLDQLTLGGPTPMFGVLAVAARIALTPSTGKVSVNYHQLNAQIILITDGKPTEIDRMDGEDIITPDKIDTVKSAICDEASKYKKAELDLHCVAVGDDADREFLFNIQLLSRNNELMTHDDGSKMGLFSTNEIAMLGDQRFVNPHRASKVDPDNKYKTVIMHGKTLVHMYKECKDDWNYPTVGSRVRRGDDWRYGNQDSNGPGTIIGHDIEETYTHQSARGVYVEWDTGDKNVYLSSHLLICDDDIRIPPRGNILAVGCIVKPCPSYPNKFEEDADIVAKRRGIVINFKTDYKALVRWKDGRRGIYTYGKSGTIREIDPAWNEDERWNNVKLEGLGEKDIAVVSRNIGGDWRMLGTTLGVPSTAMDHIAQEESKITTRLSNMLRIWRNNKGPDATLLELLQAIQNCEGAVTVDWAKIEDHFFGRNIPSWYPRVRQPKPDK